MNADLSNVKVVGPIPPEKLSKLLGNISQHRASAADLLKPDNGIDRTSEDIANIRTNIDIMDTAITILLLLVDGHNKLDSVDQIEQKMLSHIV